MGTISLVKARKAFGDAIIIPGADLDIKDGEFVVFVGPSGCGKSTLLRMIAGLEDLTSGSILIDGKNMTEEAPSKRGLSMVFQSYALYPHMSVRGNISFGLKMAGMPKDEIAAKVAKAAATLNLTEYLDRKPRQLSGGQRQRVAIGLRVNMRLEIMQMHKDLGATMIYVTHDQVEAMTMADRIVVLNRGNIEQVGTPLELYNHPDSLFVAGFIGSPKMNLMDGAPAAPYKCATIGIRPEHLDISREAGTWPATIRLAEHLGADTFLHVDAGLCGMMTVRAEGEYEVASGAKIFLTPEPSRIHRFDKDGKAIRK
jgi:multiple sugar transport system ATP-binding protein